MFRNLTSKKNSKPYAKIISRTFLIISLIVLCSTSTCGNGVIQPLEECDDGNLQNMDGCNNKCLIQSNFDCIQVLNTKYIKQFISSCLYVKPVQIIQTYLQKIPDQNKVQLRFNFHPPLTVFQTVTFAEKINDTFSVDWKGYQSGSLQVFKVAQGLQQNGLFLLRFSYDIQWTNDVQVTFYPFLTQFQIFNRNYTRLLMQVEQQMIDPLSDIKYLHQHYQQRSLTTQIYQTPSTTIVLSATSDNNLQMFSSSYLIYNVTYYAQNVINYCVILMWVIGIFHGKIVVVDFIIVLQTMLTCCMTIGQLSSGFSGLFISKLTLLCYTGLYKASYQQRPIYQSSMAQLKSSNISIYSIQNISFFLLLLLIIYLIGLIAAVLKKSNLTKYQYLLNTIAQSTFGQLALYVFFPYLIIGNLSTALFFKLISQNGIQSSLNIISMIIFNLLIPLMFFILVRMQKNCGQFQLSFLKKDVSQYFYCFDIMANCVIMYIFIAMLGTSGMKYFSLFAILLWSCIIAFNYCKKPYLQKLHITRVIILYTCGISMLILIQILTITQNKILKTYVPLVIIGTQIILCLFTGYYLFQAIRVQGTKKYQDWKKNKKKVYLSIQISNQMDIDSERQYDEYDYFQKQKKIIQQIKEKNGPKQLDFLNQNRRLQDLLPQQKKVQNIILTQEQKQKIKQYLKNPKSMKSSLKQHLLNQNVYDYQYQEIRQKNIASNRQYVTDRKNTHNFNDSFNLLDGKFQFRDRQKQNKQQGILQIQQNNNKKQNIFQLSKDYSNLQESLNQSISKSKVNSSNSSNSKKFIQNQKNKNQNNQIQLMSFNQSQSQNQSEISQNKSIQLMNFDQNQQKMHSQKQSKSPYQMQLKSIHQMQPKSLYQMQFKSVNYTQSKSSYKIQFKSVDEIQSKHASGKQVKQSSQMQAKSVLQMQVKNSSQVQAKSISLDFFDNIFNQVQQSYRSPQKSISKSSQQNEVDLLS